MYDLSKLGYNARLLSKAATIFRSDCFDAEIFRQCKAPNERDSGACVST